jgi:hypothetical protein
MVLIQKKNQNFSKKNDDSKYHEFLLYKKGSGFVIHFYCKDKERAMKLALNLCEKKFIGYVPLPKVLTKYVY